MTRLVLAAALAGSLAACRSETAADFRVRPLADRPPGAAATEPPTAWVEVVADPEGRERGLMGRPPLPRDQGMLFVYPEAAARAFWMKDCAHPLSAAFLDAAGRVVSIVEMAPGEGVPDGDLPRYASGGPARFVLEMGPAWFREAGLRAGARADLAEALRGVRAR